MSLATGLQDLFGAGLGFAYSEAVLERPGAATRDGQGGFTAGAPVPVACRAQIDHRAETARAYGFAEDKSVVMILKATIADDLPPETGQGFHFKDAVEHYTIGRIKTDPAEAVYICEATR